MAGSSAARDVLELGQPGRRTGVTRHPPVTARRHRPAGTHLGTVGQGGALELAGEEPLDEHLEPLADVTEGVLRTVVLRVVRGPVPLACVGPGVLREERDLARPEAEA